MSKRSRWGGGSGWAVSGVSIARQGALVSIGISDCVLGGVRGERYRRPITFGLSRAYLSACRSTLRHPRSALRRPGDDLLQIGVDLGHRPERPLEVVVDCLERRGLDVGHVLGSVGLDSVLLDRVTELQQVADHLGLLRPVECLDGRHDQRVHLLGHRLGVEVVA